MSANMLPEWISGTEEGRRLSSRTLEERLLAGVAAGGRYFKIEAYGQHGVGGRLWPVGDEKILLKVYGSPGQRLGSMGFPNTTIEAMGPSSDDVGWLNAGAEIIVHGSAGNGVGNAMAQGRINIAGSIGARGMTMTKHNPRFDPPELWVLGSVGDYFAEFMAGGTAVVCGCEAMAPDNILGYRPCVGMVGGRIFFRGPCAGFSLADAHEIELTDLDYNWLLNGLQAFVEKIGRPALLDDLSERSQWRLIEALSPSRKRGGTRQSMTAFRSRVWDAELGAGGLVGDLTDLDRSPIGLLPNGDLRRFVPEWRNGTQLAPCQAACPSGIPVQERWRLIRAGLMDQAVDLALAYTPFPASVCGYLCPNLCRQGCTRNQAGMEPVDVAALGRASLQAQTADLPEPTKSDAAVIGAGPAGLSTAWQLRRLGHQVTLYDRADRLGGKLSSSIPKSRIPDDVLKHELNRAAAALPNVELSRDLTRDDLDRLKAEYDYLVIAAGATKPRTLPLPGADRAVTARDFLVQAINNDLKEIKGDVVIIGAGNVGCDAATEAKRLGAGKVTLIDIQEPASFGVERAAAEAVGAVFRWPAFSQAIEADGVLLTSGEKIPAEVVIFALGDQPDLDFLGDSIELENGFIKVDSLGRTSEANIFAVGDVVAPGLLTEAIGAGRRAAEAIDAAHGGRTPETDPRPVVDVNQINLEYYDPRCDVSQVETSAQQCASCGHCRDCGLCVQICPQTAISRAPAPGERPDYRYVVDSDKCIGCGFCAGACPCGVWALVPNQPLG